MRRSATFAGLLAIAILAGACGTDDGSDDEAAVATTRAETTTTPPDTTSPAGAVTVTATDYKYEGLSDTVEPGTRFQLVNESTVEVHEIVAFRLVDAEQRPADELVGLERSELEALFAGPPATVIVAPPGEEGFVADGDGSVTEPGRYLLMCFIPTGADPAAYLAAAQANPDGPPSVPGGPPHYTAGMYAELTVA